MFTPNSVLAGSLPYFCGPSSLPCFIMAWLSNVTLRTVWHGSTLKQKNWKVLLSGILVVSVSIQKPWKQQQGLTSILWRVIRLLPRPWMMCIRGCITRLFTTISSNSFVSSGFTTTALDGALCATKWGNKSPENTHCTKLGSHQRGKHSPVNASCGCGCRLCIDSWVLFDFSKSNKELCWHFR